MRRGSLKQNKLKRFQVKQVVSRTMEEKLISPQASIISHLKSHSCPILLICTNTKADEMRKINNT